MAPGDNHICSVVLVYFVLMFLRAQMHCAPTGTDDAKHGQVGTFDAAYRGQQWDENAIKEHIANSTEILRKNVIGVLISYRHTFQIYHTAIYDGPALECQWSADQLTTQLISAMKIFQKFVGVTQKIQLLHFAKEGTKASHFLRSFRKLEFDIRSFVEDDLRQMAYLVVKTSDQSQIPPYQIGSIDAENLEEQTVKTTLGDVPLNISKHLEKLFFCVTEFGNAIAKTADGQS